MADAAATITYAPPEPHARPSLTEPSPGDAAHHVDAPPVAPSQDAHPSRSSPSPSHARSADASARTDDGDTKTCCRVCRKGKACGDTCVSLDRNCTAGPGCAGNG